VGGDDGFSEYLFSQVECFRVGFGVDCGGDRGGGVSESTPGISGIGY
jgi:hypothetical protein